MARVLDTTFGVVWLVLAGGKLAASDPSEALRSILPASSATVASGVLILLEALIGTVLVFAPGAASRRRARLAALGMLVCFGAFALVAQPATCACAGRLAALSAWHHSMLTVAMLSLGSLSHLLASGVPGAQPIAGRKALRVLSVLLLVTAGLGLLLVEAPREERRDPPVRTQVPSRAGDVGPLLIPRPAQRAALPPEPVAAAAVGERPLASIEGTVVTSLGEPVVGAVVWACTESGPGSQPVCTASVRTDEAGAVRLQVEEPVAVILVRANSHPMTCVRFSDVRVSGTQFRLVLPTGLTLHGRVVNQHGLPVSGAKVQVRGVRGEDVTWHPDSQWFDADGAPEFGEATTDGAGRFQIMGLRDVDYLVVASRPGHTVSAWGTEQVRARAGRPEPISVVVHELHDVSVRAIDAESRQALGHVSYAYMFRGGAPWTAAAELTVRARAAPAHADTDPGDGSQQSFFLSPGGNEGEAVIVSVRAVGYQARKVKVVPSRWSERAVLEVPLDRSSPQPSVPVRLVLRFAGGAAGPTGYFRLSLRPGHERPLDIPVWFVRGVLREPLQLPPGRYELGLEGAAGSVLAWRRPLASRSVVFDVEGPQATTIEVDVAGGGVALAPRDPSGRSMLEYSVSITNSLVGTSFDTWTTHPVLERVSDDGEVDGRLLWLDAGEVHLNVRKHGYVLAETRLKVGRDGQVSTWAPSLHRASVR